MSVVAGTVLEDAVDDDRVRTIFVSDLHVPAEGGDDVAAQLSHVCEEARREAADTRLLVLGDLFEFYVHPSQLEMGAWRSVRDALRDTAAAGVSVSLVRGNRDFLLDERFARLTGARVFRGGVRLRLADREVIAIHGDELCLNDVPYQRSKRILRSWPVRVLARILPLSIMLRMGRGARKTSVRMGGTGDPARFAPVGSALDEAFGVGADTLIFGHIHSPARGLRRGDHDEYLVLPAFDETRVFLEARGRDLRYRSTSGETVPDYPPREFA